MTDRCPTCGSAVKIIGNTTKHFEPVDINALLQQERNIAAAALMRLKEIIHVIKKCKKIDKDWLLDVLEAPIFTKAIANVINERGIENYFPKKNEKVRNKDNI